MAETETGSELETEAPSLLSIGQESGRNVNINIGPKFLQLFSEQLYSSPNKAFEELVSNAWDAGATSVYIGIPEDLETAPAPILWVLDNGISMDEAGLELLWAVGDDHKTRDDWERPRGREQIGKFGIGKLATYVLADELTYICKADDGVIRAISVDFRRILELAESQQQLHMEPLPLAVREIAPADLSDLLKSLGLEEAAEILADGSVRSFVEEFAKDNPSANGDTPAEQGDPPVDEGAGADLDTDEFHAAVADEHVPAEPESPNSTWTLVALTALKARGRNVSRSHVKRMLRAALPLGASIDLIMDRKSLPSAKADVAVDQRWVLGRDFTPTDVIRERTEDVLVSVAGHASPDPYVLVDGVGKVTGEIRLYERSIASGKSVARAASNGFVVNIRGRIINLHDPHFGLPALSHAAWAKVRIAVRVDGLNEDLAVSREAVEDTEAVDNFRGFLRACFNHARKHYAQGRRFPDVHELLRDEWGTVPLAPLMHVVEMTVGGEITLDLIDTTANDQGAEQLRIDIERDPKEALRDVQARPQGKAARLSTYRVADRSVVINSDHPYWIEQLTSDIDKKEMLGIAATVSLLCDAYLLEMGVDPEYVEELRTYRDQVERLIAASRRKSAPLLVDLLDQAGNDSASLENVVADCLESLGFQIQHQAQSGKPEGIATADLAPDAEENRRRYRFIYEAKSTKSADRKVTTKDVNVSGQDRHRDNAAADTDDPLAVEYALVVAPGFQRGALEEETAKLRVCPMRSADLGRLLMGAAATGSLDLVRFEDVLKLTDPDAVATAISELIDAQRDANRLSIQELVAALSEDDNVTRLSAGTISREIRRQREAVAGKRQTRPNEEDVRHLVRGLQMLAPSAVQVVGDQVVLGTSPGRLAEAIRRQTASLPEAVRFELDRLTWE
ncbi:MAG TPA: ATP-binding protein [Microbacteriaceae bacterium]|nr:ATP-binding protein [Microbacteriaceae bacterium]